MCLSLTEAFLDHYVTLGSATQPYRPQTCPNIIFKFVLTTFCCCCSVAQSCPTLSNPMDCSTPGLTVHHQPPEFTQTHVHWVGNAIQPSHPLPSPSRTTFNLSQHQGLFKWVSSLCHVAKGVLERPKIFLGLWRAPCRHSSVHVPVNSHTSIQDLRRWKVLISHWLWCPAQTRGEG